MTVSLLGSAVSEYASGVANKTWPHTLVAGDNRILFMVSSLNKYDKDIGLTTFKYGGSGGTVMTSLGSVHILGILKRCNLYIHYLLEADLPGNGSHDLYVSTAGDTGEITISGFCLQGCKQEAPHDTGSNSSTSAETKLNTTLSSVLTGSMVLSAVNVYDDESPFTPDTGYTELYEETRLSSQYKTPQGNDTLGITHSSSLRTVAYAWAVAAYGAAMGNKLLPTALGANF